MSQADEKRPLSFSIAQCERGVCLRCDEIPIVKMFLVCVNASYEWGSVPDIGAPDLASLMVCKNCLTDSEIAKLLAPAAIFVLNRFIYTGTPHPLAQSASHMKAALTLSVGADALSDQQIRELALRALG